MKKLLILASSLLCTAAVAEPLYATTYSLTTIPALPGSIAMIGSALNNRGDVAGYTYTREGGVRAFSSINGNTRYIPTLGGDRNQAVGINDSGQVVGISQTADYEYRPFLFAESNGVSNLGGLGGRQSYASGINNSGVVSGYGDTDWPGYYGFAAFTVTGSAFPSPTSFGTMQPAGSYAYAINENGATTGGVYLAEDGSGTRAYISSGDTVRLLDIPGTTFSVGRSINDDGHVAGYFTSIDGSSGAFYFDGETVKSLGTISDASILGFGLGTPSYSSALGLNNSGTIVGVYGYSGYQGRAFVYSHGEMRDLTSLLDSDALNKYVITDALAINDRGRIVAYGYRPGEYIGTTLLLTPNEVPEPVSISLLCVGLLGVGYMRSRRR